MNPAFAYVERREPFSGPQFFGENIEGILPERHDIDNLPEPVRQGEFWNVGKPSVFRWAHMPIAFHFNIAGIRAVMEDTFAMNKVFGTLVAFAPRSGQNPWGSRANIERPPSMPFGDQTVVNGGGIAGYTPGNISVNGLNYDF